MAATMKYVRLGESGLKVSKIILGCMNFGSKNSIPWAMGEEESIALIKAAYDRGINTFDTADMYSSGLSEEYLGKALKQHQIPREKVVVSTKIYSPVHDVPGETAAPMLFAGTLDANGYVNRWGLSRKHIFAAVQSCLQRLQLEYIDVLQIHRFDNDTPIAETMRALHDVVQKGWVRYIACGSCWAYQLQAMQNYALNNNLTPFIAVQNHYSALYREEEREMMPTLKMLGMGSFPWRPLAGGYLCRPFSDREASKRAEVDVFGKATYSAADKAIIDAVETIAKKRGISMTAVALAWTFTKVTAPVVGPTNVDALDDYLNALQVELTEEEIKSIEEPYQARAIFGHF
ncbi:Aldo/keto reductase [Atractiella rhizophila]|nr:Aldo/keto reductase [Atractiella rhizophila]